jgi:hypothetical protein
MFLHALNNRIYYCYLHLYQEILLPPPLRLQNIQNVLDNFENLKAWVGNFRKRIMQFFLTSTPFGFCFWHFNYKDKQVSLNGQHGIESS